MKLLILSFIMSMYSPKSCLEMDIIFLVDLSGSVAYHQDDIADALTGFINEFDLSNETIRMGIVMFGADATTLSELTSNKNKIYDAINFIRNNDILRVSNMYDGIIVSIREFNKSPRSFVPKHLIIISDGGVDTPMLCKEMLEQAKLQDIAICTILANGMNVDESFLKDIASNGCYVKTNYNLLVNEIKKLELCI